MDISTVIPHSFTLVSLHPMCSLSSSLLIACLASLIFKLILGFYFPFGYLNLATSLLIVFVVLLPKYSGLEIDSLLGQDFKNFLICSIC